MGRVMVAVGGEGSELEFLCNQSGKSDSVSFALFYMLLIEQITE